MENKNRNSISNLFDAYRKVAPFLNIGIAMASTIAICMGIGYLVDKKLDTAPVFIVIGAVFGMVAAFVNFFKAVKNLNKDNN